MLESGIVVGICNVQQVRCSAHRPRLRRSNVLAFLLSNADNLCSRPMRICVIFTLLLMLPAFVLPGGVAGVHCLAACCMDDELGDACCGETSRPGLQISEIPSCCLESAAWVTPNLAPGTLPELRLDLDCQRPSLPTIAFARRDDQRPSACAREQILRPPDRGRISQLLI